MLKINNLTQTGSFYSQYFILRRFFMEEKITATIRNENDERQEVEIIVDDIELTPEMEEELSNGNGGEE